MSGTPTTSAMSAHPCYSFSHSLTSSRVHLPVAPRCNVQCRFCDRSFDCANESRPGVTARLLRPQEALWRVDSLRSRLEGLAVVGIAGPGDPLANPRESFETFRLVKEKHPDLLLCLATNGLTLVDHVDEIGRLGVSHLTVTVNAVDPEVGKEIYAWVRFEGRARTGTEAARLLWDRQREGIALAARQGLEIKINTILVPGVNEGEVERIARECAALGAKHMNLVPLIPVKGTALEGAGAPSLLMVAASRARAEAYLPQLSHCMRCRADAAGKLGEDIGLEQLSAIAEELVPDSDPVPTRPCGQGLARLGETKALTAAVASREGFFVNQHLGEADRLFVFRIGSDGKITSQGTRSLPPGGGGARRWEEVADIVSDCGVLLVGGIGAPPRRALEVAGVSVHVVEGLISEALRAAAVGKDLGLMSKRPEGCGSSCSGGASRGCGCA
jgi:nitrogen fixation protein NifB